MKIKNKGDTQFTLMLGFEIEAVYNATNKFLKIGDYHSFKPPYLPFSEKQWVVEKDGSLNRSNIWYEEQPVEFISVPVLFDEAFKCLITFKKAIQRNTKNKNLSDALHFNNSTGAHLNFSLWKLRSDVKTQFRRGAILTEKIGEQIPINKYPPQSLPQLKHEIVGILKRNFKKKWVSIWLQHYNRKMAEVVQLKKRTAIEIYEKQDLSRYIEFNIQTGKDLIEWRSIHLRGITTWEELFKFYGCCFKALYNCFLREDKKIIGVIKENDIIQQKPKNRTEKKRYKINQIEGVIKNTEKINIPPVNNRSKIKIIVNPKW